MVSTSFAAPVGEVLDGKFRVTKEIGRGGMAVVYAAENIGIGKPVAVKILSEDLATSKTVTERFLREARAAAKIQSPYVCEVYDVGTYQDRPFIVMELLVGESLYDRLARERQLGVDDTLRIAIQTAKGLKRAHDISVVHRDLKPENIFLIRGEDGGPQTKLVDFGLAKFYEPHLDVANARLTKEGALFGTPAYMSPEQAKGKGSVDHRSDLWALGCIVYEMLTGRTVWDVEQGVAMILAQIASSPLPKATTYRPDLPPAFDEWLQRALSRRVEGRFRDADEFIVELKSALSAGDRSSPLGSSPTPHDPISPPQVAFNAPSGAHPGRLGELAQPSTAARKSRPWHYAVAAFVLGGALGGLVYFGRLPWFGGDEAPLAESSPFSAEVAEAQAALAKGKLDEGLELLKSAFDQGQGKAARSLVAHVTVAQESPGGSCRLTGIAHPRPFDSATESSKPMLLASPKGLLVTWADVGSGGTTQARTTLLDSALRRISVVENITPEANTVRDPELLDLGERAGMLFWDFAGNRAGAYTRLLDEQGRVAGPPQLLSTTTANHPYEPAIAADDDGTFWVVWVEPSRERVFDLFVRHLDAKLQPLGEAIALTGYATPVQAKKQAARPSIAIAGKLLVVSYTLRRAKWQQVMMLRVLKDKVTNGASAIPDTRPAAPGDEESDRFLGQVIQVSEQPGRHDQSTVRCGTAGCFVSWDDSPTAGHVALLRDDGSFVWRRSLGAGSGRPGLGLFGNASTGLISWYQNKRVNVAPLDQNAPGEASVVGRASAELQQPPPIVVANRQAPGQWYVAWRGYEAAVPEPFVSRVDCK